MLTRRALIACATASPFAALPSLDHDIRHMTQLSRRLSSLPLSAKHRVFAGYVRQSVLELTMIDNSASQCRAYEYRSRLTHIIGFTG